VVKFSE
jgi:hypothetical protein